LRSMPASSALLEMICCICHHSLHMIVGGSICLVSPLFSEPRLVSGSEIALPAAALRVPAIIIKHRDGHKNQLTSE
jgi:hypothetical protein